MRHFVIGTAGHIDHGKSALVKALTGTDPDRLEEEKRRGMTIDLGFAHFDLPSGRRVGIVDVPGHERLIKNMLAGATGIDLVFLVVAADEGVMPQTREHLDILRFLPVSVGIVVLNKIDLVNDEDWLALVKDDLRALVSGTFLEGAPVIEVSARTGEGIPALVQAMDRMLDGVPEHDARGPVRLPIDRSFVMPGFGTVVTGSLWSGRIAPGDVLEILPLRRSVRVRNVQSHGHDVDAGTAGSRVAVNLVGIEKQEVRRGDVLSTPGVFEPTALIDVRLRLLSGASTLKHLNRIRLYVGSGESIGRVRLLDRTEIKPGESTVAQIQLEAPLVTATGDPFVIRRYSPMLTLGGGEVLDPHPPRRARNAGSVDAIEAATAGFATRLERTLLAAGRGGSSADEIVRALAAGKAQVEGGLGSLVTVGTVIDVRGRFFHKRIRDEVAAAVQQALDAFHAAMSWRAGIPRDELKTRVFPSGDNRLYAQVLQDLVAERAVEEAGEMIRRTGFVPVLSEEDTAVRDRIAATLRDGRFAPPSRDELAKAAADGKIFDKVFQALLDDGTVVGVGGGVFFHRDVLEEIKRIVTNEIAQGGSITVASLRDRLQTSRKFALTVLEHFDTIRVTRRVGDARVLVKSRE